MAVFLFPGRITDHCDGLGPLAVVVSDKCATGISANAEHGKVISRHVLPLERLGGLAAAAAPDAHQSAARLESGEFVESAGMVAEHFVLLIGEDRPIIFQAAADATVDNVADAIEFARPGDRQGFQQYGVHQSKDGGCRANAERERQHGGGGETRSTSKLADRITDIV